MCSGEAAAPGPVAASFLGPSAIGTASRSSLGLHLLIWQLGLTVSFLPLAEPWRGHEGTGVIVPKSTKGYPNKCEVSILFS